MPLIKRNKFYMKKQNQHNIGEPTIEFLTLYVNPLYLIFGRKDTDTMIDTLSYLDDEDEDVEERYEDNLPRLTWRYGSIKTELSHTSSDDHRQLRKLIGKYFSSLQFELGDSLPILLITFVFSINIAINLSLRTYFFSNFEGKIPVFTQFVFNCMRTGLTEDGKLVDSIVVDPSYEFYLDERHSSFVSILHLEQERSDNMCLTVLTWFKLLDHYLSNNNLYFKHFVPLIKKPLLSEKPLTLTSFGKGMSKVPENVFFSKNKEKYEILNKVLNVRIISSQWKEKLPQKRDILSDIGGIDQENRLANQLIDLIMNCSPASLEPSRPPQKSTRRFKIISVILLCINIGLLFFDILKRG